jgi:hypothetical protein
MKCGQDKMIAPLERRGGATTEISEIGLDDKKTKTITTKDTKSHEGIN